jgi:hypothetical protein
MTATSTSSTTSSPSTPITSSVSTTSPPPGTEQADRAVRIVLGDTAPRQAPSTTTPTTTGSNALRTRIEQQRPAPHVPTLAEVEQALLVAEQALAALPRTGLEDLLEHPHDAFFNVENLTSDGEGWRDLFQKITLTSADLRRSAQVPVTLEPLNLSLFRGCVFPDAYFMRSTMYFNEYRGMFMRAGDADVPAIAQRMPFIELQRSADGMTAKVHTAGGARRIFDALRAVHAGDEVVAFRGCSKTELELQRFVAGLLDTPAAPLSPDHRAALQQIAAARDDSLTEVLRHSIAFDDDVTCAAAATHLADLLGGQNQATFVGFDAAKAEDFRSEADADSGDEGEVIIRYRLPWAELERLVDEGVLYVGTEFGSVEAGFTAPPDAPHQQGARHLLFRMIADDDT